MCIIASISANECFSAVDWLRSVIFKAFHRFFSLILISEVWQCLSRILTFHIRGPSSFCLEKNWIFFLSFEICCSVKHYCCNLRSLAPRISFSICLYLVLSFFACIPTRRSVLALETDSHSAKQSAQCCRADEVRAVHSTCSPVCYSWHYVSFLLMTHFREASNWSHLCFSFKNKSACSHIQLLK